MDTELEHSSDVVKRECKFLEGISVKLTEKITDLVRNEIAQNLQLLNDNVSQKLDKLSAYMNESINQFCEYRLQECDGLHKSIAEIKKNIQAVRKGDYEIMEEQERFKKVRPRSTDNPYSCRMTFY